VRCEKTSTSFWRVPHSITAGGQAVVSSRRNHDIKEQETGVALATKLPQIVRSQLRPGGQRQGELYSTDGRAVVSSRRNCDIKEQETGVELALKLPRSQLRPGAGLRQGQLILRL
jgi:ribosomal protein L34